MVNIVESIVDNSSHVHNDDTMEFAFTTKYYFSELKKEYITMFWRCPQCIDKLFIIRENQDTKEKIYCEV